MLQIDSRYPFGQRDRSSVLSFLGSTVETDVEVTMRSMKALHELGFSRHAACNWYLGWFSTYLTVLFSFCNFF